MCLATNLLSFAPPTLAIIDSAISSLTQELTLTYIPFSRQPSDCGTALASKPLTLQL